MHLTMNIFKYIFLNGSLRIFIIFTDICSQDYEPASFVVMIK